MHLAHRATADAMGRYYAAADWGHTVDRRTTNGRIVDVGCLMLLPSATYGAGMVPTGNANGASGCLRACWHIRAFIL